MPKILDHRGLPFQKSQLNKAIGAPTLTSVRSVWNLGGSVLQDLTPDYLGQLLRNARMGSHHDYLTLAEEMEEQDPHYQSVLGTRKRAIQGVAAVVEAASEDKKDVELAEAVRSLVRQAEFDDMILDALDGLGKGYSCVEIIWDTKTTPWMPKYAWRDPRFFQFDEETLSEVRLLDETAVDGIELPAFKFITHLPKLKSGFPIRGGLAMLVAFSYMCKNFTLRDWMAFSNVFGMPLRLGRYGANASEEDVETLVDAVANMAFDAAAVLPESMKIEFQQTATGTGVDMFRKQAEFLDMQISKAVLGQTMTADSGSSLSQSTTHNEVRHDILRADCKQLAATLNRDLIKPYIDLNFGVQENYPRLTLPVPKPENIKLMVEALEKLIPMGLKVEGAVVLDKLGLPDPVDGYILKAPTPAAKPVATNTALNRQQADDLLELEELEDWQPQMQGAINPVMSLAASVDNYDDFLSRLPDLLKDMDTEQLIEKLAMAAFKARGAGSQDG